ncbi:hypothetical protein OG225_41825 (plasmid) [Nocardia sp. NBC_01377]|uniref:hypothetical protein n=1 Tax=Nocardia sp. NBC_01377 TaxID=2903595 RepID=UPI002F916E8F
MEELGISRSFPTQKIAILVAIELAVDEPLHHVSDLRGGHRLGDGASVTELPRLAGELVYFQRQDSLLTLDDLISPG